MGTEQASGTGLGTHSSIATCSQIQPAHAGCDRGDNTLRHPLQLETGPDWRRVSHPPPSCAAGAPGGVTSCGRQSPGRAQHVPSPGVRENAVPAYPLGPQGENHLNLKQDTFNANLKEVRRKQSGESIPWTCALGTASASTGPLWAGDLFISAAKIGGKEVTNVPQNG